MEEDGTKRVGLVMMGGAMSPTPTAGLALAAVRYGVGGNDVISDAAYADQMYGYAGDDLMCGLLQDNDRCTAGGEWTPYTAAPAPTKLRPRQGAFYHSFGLQ